jgi:cell wall-associated NlpC family hydrolase
MILILTFTLLFASPTVATAKNHKPTLAQIAAAKKAEIEKAQRAALANSKLDHAKRTLRQLTQAENAARDRLVRAQKRLEIATSTASKANTYAKNVSKIVMSTRSEIGKLAANAYMMGGQLTDIESILNADGPQELLDQLAILDRLGSGNKTALTRFKSAQRNAERAKLIAKRAKIAQLVETHKVAVAKTSATKAQNEQEAAVAKLQLVQDELLKELASAKRVRVTLEQRRQLALLEEARANRASQTKGQSKIWKYDGTSGRLSIRTSQTQRNRAVEFARKQVLANKPYVWGAQGPNSFDCSGLVYAAYRYAGLGWPNWDRLNASLYYSYTKHVAFSEMQPGDLLFYSYDGRSSNIHHMSIYAGGGMVWEARSTRSGLRYSSMYSVDGLMPFAGRV